MICRRCWPKFPWNRASQRVTIPSGCAPNTVCGTFEESGCLGMQPKRGGKFHLRLNIGTRPIANKYREGKMKSTLKRKLRVRETVSREAHGISNGDWKFRWGEVGCGEVQIRRTVFSALRLRTVALFQSPRQRVFGPAQTSLGKVALSSGGVL